LTVLVFCLCLTLFNGAWPARAQTITPNSGTWIANGSVRAIVNKGEVTYIGGDFTAIGPNTGRGAKLDDTTGTPDTSLPRVNGVINSVAPDGSGGWYIGGSFTFVGQVSRNRVAHIMPDGSLDAVWNPNSNSTVSTLAVSGGVVYAGGAFTNIGGLTRYYVAALNTSNGNATGWNPRANGSVAKILVGAAGATVYLSGTFTTIQGSSGGPYTRNRVAAVSSTTWNPTAFNPDSNGTVSTLAFSPDGLTLYAGGAFTGIGGATPLNYIAALDPTTGVASTWNPGPSAAVSTIVVGTDSSTVYAGGSFTTIGGGTRNRIAGLSASTGLVTAFNADSNNVVNTMALSADGDTIYAGGTFTTMNGVARNYVAGLNASTGLPTTWDPNANGSVAALEVSGTTVFAGGSFYSIGRCLRNRIAALNTATGAGTNWNPGASAAVYAVLVSPDGNTVYAGGSFTSIGGQTRNRLAALSASTGLATAWNPNPSSTVYSLAKSLDGNTVYAGGAFTSIGGQTRNRLAALSASTGLATTWNPNLNSTANVVVMDAEGTTLYVGGLFTRVQGASGGPYTRNRIAAVSTAVANPTAWNPNMSGGVSAIALSPDATTVYTGGAFTVIQGASGGPYTRNFVAAVNSSTGNPSAWDANADNTVLALSTYGDSVFAGGTFTSIGGQLRNYLAGLSTVSGAASDFAPNPNASVLAVSAGPRLYGGGSFTQVGSQDFAYFAQFQYPAPVVTGVSPNQGDRGQTLTGVSIGGSSFRNTSLTVQLRRGAETVTGTGVSWVSPTQVTADFTIPDGATVGTDWSLFLQNNDDGQSCTLPNVFSVQYPPPVVTGISPGHGNQGQTLTGVSISGSALRDVDMTLQLKRGPDVITASNVNYVSEALATADLTIPAGATVATDWSVYLQNNDDGKSFTLPDAFTVQYPPPNVTGISPNHGNRGQSLTGVSISGSAFRNVPMTLRLQRGGETIAGTSVTWVSPTNITADFAIPAGATVATNWAVYLQNSDDGKSSALSDAFAVQYPPPVVTGISPDRGNQGQTLTGVSIYGAGLRNTSMTVQLKRGAEAIAASNVTWVSATEVTADFAIPSDAPVATDWSVYLKNDDDGKNATLNNTFTVLYPPPSVYSIAPASGNNDGPVHITNLAGNDFLAGAVIKLSLSGEPDIVATGVTVISGNKITCDFDLAGAVTGLWDVTVTNTDGKHGTLAGGFAVQHLGPTVTAITPSYGINNGVVHVTDLQGTSFLSGATVTLRKPGKPDIDAYNVVVSAPDKITCDFNLAGRAAYDRDVVVRNTDGQWGMLEDGFSVQDPAPVVTEISPDVGDQGETLTGVSISGSDFRDTSVTILLKRGAQTITASNVRWVSPTLVTADFTIPGSAAVGTDWDVFLQNNDDSKSSTLPDSFEVQYAPPVATAIAPSSGTNDGSVHITNLAGSAFRAGAAVSLSMPGQPDIDATGVTVTPPGRIMCDFDLTGATTGAWDVTVTNTDGKSGTLLGGFSVEFPAPTVLSITPPSAINDSLVHVTDLAGTDFRVGATVRLHKSGQADINATSVLVVTPTRIACDLDIIGKAVGDWSVIVTNDDAKSATLEDGFNIQYPVPVVDGINPSHGNLGELLDNVTITGSDFRNTAMTVRLLHGAQSIDGTDVHRVSATELTADFYIPYGAAAGPGWDVYLQNNDDGKSSTLVGAFTVEYPEPIITSMTPSTGTNDGVVHVTGLLGANFRTGAVVRLSQAGQPDIPAGGVTVVTESRITCDFDLTGAATGTWDVTVTNTDLKSGTLAGAFSIRFPSPTIASITPDAADNDAPVDITDLAGTNFRDSAAVKLHKSGRPDINASSVVVSSSTLITCVFDLAGKSVGDWSVIVTNDDGKSATLEAGFSIQYPAPGLTGMDPNSGPAGTTVRNVTIEGSNFRNTSATVELSRGSDTIFGTNVRWVSPGEALCDFPLDGAPEGPGWSLYYAHNDDGKGALLTEAFTVDPAPQRPPVVTGVTPSGGIAGDSLAISGINFGDDQRSSCVTFNEVPVADYMFWSDSEIDVVVPGGATTGPVRVCTAGGTSNKDKDYTITTPAWYLAEGSTAWGFSAYITIMNPNNASLHAQLTYMLNNGGTVKDIISLPPLSQVTVNPADKLGAADFSTQVECVEGKTISVDRTMCWTGAGAAGDEGHCSVGTTLPSKTWYLPEGCSAYGFETWLLIQNPTNSAADVTVTYMVEGVGAKTFKKSVLAHARATYNIADDIGSYSASIKVASSRSVIAERATYRDNRREGQESIGATFASKSFYLPEGTTAWGYSTFVLVQNPNNATARVRFTYMTPSGAVTGRPFDMAPMSRTTVDVSDQLPNTDFSTLVASDRPIVAERSMYWSTSTGQACHDSIGLAQAHMTYYFPDGQTSQGRETYTLVQNPNSTSVNVDVIYYGSNGSFDIVVRKTLQPFSRATFNMADKLHSGRAAILVRCTTPGEKILAERSMYWNHRGAGTDTVGGFSD
jgi:hypothetical protein